MTTDESHYALRPGSEYYASAGAMATGAPEWEGTGPLVGFGLLLHCCPDAHRTTSVGISLPVAEAGRLIAAITEHASRHGLEYALQAAIDQGQAWARRAPR